MGWGGDEEEEGRRKGGGTYIARKEFTYTIRCVRF